MGIMGPSSWLLQSQESHRVVGCSYCLAPSPLWLPTLSIFCSLANESVWASSSPSSTLVNLWVSFVGFEE